MISEPSVLEMLLTKLAFFFFGKSIYKEFANRLPLVGGERVLDFGCGMGTVAYYAARRLKNGHITCADVSNRWLAACQKTLREYENITFLDCKGESPVLGVENYDLIFCHFVLHDIPENDLGSVMEALVASLKVGGRFVFREHLGAVERMSRVKSLAERNGLSLETSRITDIKIMGNTIESKYIKL